MIGGKVHPDCSNASNPYLESNDFRFKRIYEAKAVMDMEKHVTAVGGDKRKHTSVADNDSHRYLQNGLVDLRDHRDANDDTSIEENVQVEFKVFAGRKKRLFNLQLKMNEARKANQTEMVAEKKRLEAPPMSRGVSTEKWIEEKNKRIGKLLEANGLDMSRSYMLDTQEIAEAKYRRWTKKPAPVGWEVFSQKALYRAYKKRTKNIVIDIEEYNRLKEASALQYGEEQEIPEMKIERMVNELKELEKKRKKFSRRRKFCEEKDTCAINERNEHFNRKIERFFGRYTLEIKNNLERGTALPD